MLQELIRLTENKLNHLSNLIYSAESVGNVDAIIQLQNEKVEVEDTLAKLKILAGGN